MLQIASTEFEENEAENSVNRCRKCEHFSIMAGGGEVDYFCYDEDNTKESPDGIMIPTGYPAFACIAIYNARTKEIGYNKKLVDCTRFTPTMEEDAA